MGLNLLNAVLLCGGRLYLDLGGVILATHALNPLIG